MQETGAAWFLLEFLGEVFAVYSLVFFLRFNHFNFVKIRYALSVSSDKLEQANKIQFDSIWVRAQRERVSTALNNAESTTEVGCTQPDEG